MKLTICTLITRSSVSILSYSISAWSITALFFCVVILLASHTQTVVSSQTNQMERFCSCGLQVPQQKFCEHDFVIAGKRVNRRIVTFNQRNSLRIPDLLPYRGQIYRIRITFNFKGVFKAYSKQKVFVKILVLNCGIMDSVELRRQKNYVISGYQYRQWLIVTSCSWLQPFSEITTVQALGLFSNFYQNYCFFNDKCQITFYYKKFISRTDGCKVNITFKECYEKYAICQRQSNNKCGIMTNITALSNTSQISHLPELLRTKYERDRSQRFDKFNFCLRKKFNNNNSWRSV